MRKIRDMFLTIVVALLFVACVAFYLNSKNIQPKSIFWDKNPATIEIKVRKGWTLSEIAQDLGTNSQEIAILSDLENPDEINSGQKLKVIPFSQSNIVEVSWYGEKFHGELMANQKTFDMYDPTIVAQKWLPFGTKVRLTDIHTGKNIIVIVQDRGPYHENRCFDLSMAAAEELGIKSIGVAKCKVEILN